MKNLKIGVYDSGYGGLYFVKSAIESNINATYYYLGDNNNAPYGQKSKEELSSLFIKNITTLESNKVDIIVVACNTLSVSVLSKIKQFANVKVFGVFPPIEKQIIKNKKTILLATPITSKYFQNVKELTSVGLKDLVFQIEQNKNVNVYDHLKDENISIYNFDHVVLGCTHFERIKSQLFSHFCPHEITSGIECTIEKVKEYIKNNKTYNFDRKSQVIFIGECKDKNKKFFYNVVN